MAWSGASALFAGSAEIFSGPAAEYVVAPPVAKASPEVVRWVWVQERMQVDRRGAAVRAPIFFSAGECRDPGELALVRWPSRERVPVQVDDVRRDADGGVARLHLWFKTDLRAEETQRWALVRRDKTDMKQEGPAVAVAVHDGHLEVEASGSEVKFYRELDRYGPLASLQLANGPALEFSDGAGAAATLLGATGAGEAVTPGTGGSLDWGSGPIFAKVAFRNRDKSGASEIEQVFRVFSDGSINLIQTIKLSGAEGRMTVKTQDFLSGQVRGAENLIVRPQSAGLIASLADVHRGYQVDGLWEDKRSQGWLVVPGSLGGTAGRVELERHRQFRLRAPGAMTSGEGDARPGTVRAFWSEVTLYPAKREGAGLARAVLLAASQPLVAAVDRPGLDVAAAVARIQDNVREMKPVGWVNETVVRHLSGRPATFPKRNWVVEEDPAHWLAAAQRAEAKVTKNSSRPLAEHEKGRAAGSLDPYHITYGSTGLAFWLMRDELPRAPQVSLRAQLEAVRRHLARTDEGGWPYLDVFARNQNMQMGPPFLAMADRDADPDLRRFYRDQLAAPPIAAVQLHGQRPYEGRPQPGSVPSDALYQGVVDFFLHASELVLNESLGFQPVAFGRYLDAIDVNADLYHPAHARAAEQGFGFSHANFFRTQSHLHRWLNWGPAPFIALLQSPAEDGLVPGSTEVWYFANALAGRWKNWPDQSWLFLASELPRQAAAFAPPPRPEQVKSVRIQRDKKGNHVTWEKNPQATSYRVYRLRTGQSPVWLNSPYRTGGEAAAESLGWDDAGGDPEDRYRVHVIDSAGRESGW